jgi:small subunit ribosomal protein S8
MLTRLRNAGHSHHPGCSLPTSKVKTAIADVLKTEGYIQGYTIEGEGAQSALRIDLKYLKNRKPVIAGMKRVSKPSRRVYVGAKQIPRVMGGLGTVILSTPQGIMSGRQARKQNVGGEVIAYVW